MVDNNPTITAVKQWFWFMPQLLCPDWLACPTWLAVEKHGISGLDRSLNFRVVHWIARTFLAHNTEHLAHCLLEGVPASNELAVLVAPTSNVRAARNAPSLSLFSWLARAHNLPYWKLLRNIAMGKWAKVDNHYDRRINDVTNALLVHACEHALREGDDYIGWEPLQKEHRAMTHMIIVRCTDSRPLEEYETPCFLFLSKAIGMVAIANLSAALDSPRMITLLRRHILAIGPGAALAAIRGTWHNSIALLMYSDK